MALQPGRLRLGPELGRIALRTFRDGLASQAGHDLTIEVTRWSGSLETGTDLVPVSLEVRVDMGSLTVRDGSGGLKPLTGSDRREIAGTARKVLSVARHPEAVFSATGFRPGTSGGGTISGELTLAGVTRPLRLQVARTGEDSYRAAASVAQTAFGITPYRAFLGALRVRDAVDVEVDIDLAAAAGQARP